MLVIFLTVLIDLIGFGIIIPLSPYLATHFGADALDVGLLMAVYSGAQFLFAPFWGQLSDRIGRRPIILVSLLGGGLSYILFAFATQLWVLYVARALAGFFGANISTAFAYMADITSEKDRSKGMGLIGAAFGLGFVIGPFLGGFFGEVGKYLGDLPPFGESFAAIVAAVICLGNFVAAYFVLEESLKDRSAARQRGSRLKNLSEYFQRPVLPILYVMFFFTTLAMANMEAASFLYVKDKFGWNLKEASFGFAYIGLIMVFTQGYLIRKVLPLWGERKTLIIGLITFFISLFWIGSSNDITNLAISFTLLALGNGLLHPSISGSISLSAKPNEQGAVMGVSQSLASMGRILGPVAGGFIYKEWGMSFPFWAGGGLGALAALLCFANFSKLPSKAKETPDSKGDFSSHIGIGLFQLKNLLKNEIPFTYLFVGDEEQLKSVELDVLKLAVAVQENSVIEHISQRASDKLSPILITCQTGTISMRVAEKLTQLSYRNVYIVDGGVDQLKTEHEDS